MFRLLRAGKAWLGSNRGGYTPLPGEAKEFSECGILWALHRSHCLRIQGQVGEVAAVQDAPVAVTSATPDQHQLRLKVKTLALARAEAPGLPAVEVVLVHGCVCVGVDRARQLPSLHMHTHIVGTETACSAASMAPRREMYACTAQWSSEHRQHGGAQTDQAKRSETGGYQAALNRIRSDGGRTPPVSLLPTFFTPDAASRRMRRALPGCSCGLTVLSHRCPIPVSPFGWDWDASGLTVSIPVPTSGRIGGVSETAVLFAASALSNTDPMRGDTGSGGCSFGTPPPRRSRPLELPLRICMLPRTAPGAPPSASEGGVKSEGEGVLE